MSSVRIFSGGREIVCDRSAILNYSEVITVFPFIDSPLYAVHVHVVIVQVPDEATTTFTAEPDGSTNILFKPMFVQHGIVGTSFPIAIGEDLTSFYYFQMTLQMSGNIAQYTMLANVIFSKGEKM